MFYLGRCSYSNFLANWLLKLSSLKGEDGAFIARRTVLAADILVGGGTRVNGPAMFRGPGRITIGRYCAIGHGFRCIAGNHNVSHAGQQVRLLRQLGVENLYCQGEIKIGNDVWIGDNVLILSGSRVGDGAIIGAGAVVTGSVPDFSISVGVPARIVKRRFSEEMGGVVAATKWWERSVLELREFAAFFSLDLSNVTPEHAKQVWSSCERQGD